MKTNWIGVVFFAIAAIATLVAYSLKAEEIASAFMGIAIGALAPSPMKLK